MNKGVLVQHSFFLDNLHHHIITIMVILLYQIKLLVEEIRALSEVTDFLILGGDFNSDPLVNQDETTLTDITNIMASSIDEIFPNREVRILIDIDSYQMVFLKS